MPAGTADERTRLINVPQKQDDKTPEVQHGLFPPLRRVMFTAFLLATTFAFTQTSLIYSFRVMTCDEWYKTHVWDGQGDRCDLRTIDARAARNVAIMSSTTTICTVLNLFLTSSFVKRYGPKAAMFQQTFWAALRNLCQITAQIIGGGRGITIIQLSQMFNILGSAGGYQLAANSFVAELAPEDDRTGMFGFLGGIIKFGSSAGYIFGGLAYDYGGQLAPFEITFCLLVFCTFFGFFFLPYVAPEPAEHTSEKGSKSFWGPFKPFFPRRVQRGGRETRDLSLMFIALGTFGSTLATGYVSMMLQLVGTNVFGFSPSTNGPLLSLTLLVKAFFLTALFPKILSWGRARMAHRAAQPVPVDPAEHPESPLEAEAPSPTSAPRTDLAPRSASTANGSEFDLHFLRWSIFADGLLTSLVTFSNRGWHLFLAAAVLPFASGTAPAARGVTLDLVSHEERSDALGGIALIEKLAQFSTVSIFGFVFSALTQIGKPTLVFAVNAGVAMLSFIVLLFARMPKEGQIALA